MLGAAPHLTVVDYQAALGVTERPFLYFLLGLGPWTGRRRRYREDVLAVEVQASFIGVVGALFHQFSGEYRIHVALARLDIHSLPRRD